MEVCARGETCDYGWESAEEDRVYAVADCDEGGSGGFEGCAGEHLVGRATISGKTCSSVRGKIREGAHGEVWAVREHGNGGDSGGVEGDRDQAGGRSDCAGVHVGGDGWAGAAGERGAGVCGCGSGYVLPGREADREGDYAEDESDFAGASGNAICGHG